MIGSLSIQQLSKGFKRYSRRRGRLLEWLGWPPQHTTHWALREINLAVNPGESVGLIGANGSGKSTLLKIIASVMAPSSGTVSQTGRVAALLELGLGFHAEFTGRENVVIAGQLAGLRDAEIVRAMSEIEQFADIGDAIDQPVRTYSSGMQVRLAFSVATAVRPDILIVDEALAVGDLFFQQKCFDRIREFKDAGTTLFFVSHSMATVYSLCDRVALLDHGRLIFDGAPKEGIDIYSAMAARLSNQAQSSCDISKNLPNLSIIGPGGASDLSNSKAGSYESGQVLIEQVSLRVNGAIANTVESGSEVEVMIGVEFLQDLGDPHVGFQIRDARGQPIYMTHTHGLGLSIGPARRGDKVTVSFKFLVPLSPGPYSVTAGIADQGGPQGSVRYSLSRRQDAAELHVIAPVDSIYWQGVCNLAPSCQINFL